MAKLEMAVEILKMACQELVKSDCLWHIFFHNNQMEVHVSGKWLAEQDFVKGKRFYYTAKFDDYHHIAIDLWGAKITACLSTDELCRLWLKTRETEPSNIVKIAKVA